MAPICHQYRKISKQRNQKSVFSSLSFTVSSVRSSYALSVWYLRLPVNHLSSESVLRHRLFENLLQLSCVQLLLCLLVDLLELLCVVLNCISFLCCLADNVESLLSEGSGSLAVDGGFREGCQEGESLAVSGLKLGQGACGDIETGDVGGLLQSCGEASR